MAEGHEEHEPNSAEHEDRPVTRTISDLGLGTSAVTSEPIEDEPPPRELGAADILGKVGREAREQRTRLERRMLIGTAAVLVVFAILGWITDGAIFTSPWRSIIAFEAEGKASRLPAINCQMRKNKRTPYCIERRAQQRETWNGIVRNTDGRASQFTLHGKP